MANLQTLTAFSPAKINLGLIIKKELASGYHEVDTIYQQVSLTDELSFELLSKNEIEIQSNIELPKKSENTIYQAIELLKNESGFSEGVRVKINKQTPVQSGLAGGSSNAATTLMAINEMLHLNLSKNVLTTLAKKIGADVAYHLYGGVQREIQGGEFAGTFQQLTSLPNCWIVLCFPGVTVGSQEAYRAWNERDYQSGDQNLDKLAQAINSQDLSKIGQELVNDFEPWFFGKYPEMIFIKQNMSECGAVGTLLSGKGSSIYGLFPSKETAQLAVNKLTPSYKQTFLLQPYEGKTTNDSSKKN